MSEKIKFIFFKNFCRKSSSSHAKFHFENTSQNAFDQSLEKFMNFKIISPKNVPLYTQKSILGIAAKIFSLKVRIIALFPFKSNFWQFFLLNVIGNDDLIWRVSNVNALNLAVEHVSVAISSWWFIIVSLIIHQCFIEESLMFSWWNIAGFNVEKHWKHGWNIDVSSKIHQCLRCSNWCIIDAIDDNINKSSMLPMCSWQG